MKPCLDKTFDKNGNEIIRFSATPLMQAFAIRKAQRPDLDDPEILRSLKKDPGLARKWRERYNPYFEDWLEEYMEASIDPEVQAEILDTWGFMKAVQGDNFQFWRESARTRGVIKEEVKEQKITINTDFSQILIAGESLEDARRRILAEKRGVVLGGRPSMAIEAGGREPRSPENRASDVQEGSLALPNPLDPDGGRSEHGTSLPAVSKQNTSRSSNKKMAGRKVPARSQK